MIRKSIFLAFIFAISLFSCGKKTENTYIHISGKALGTFYNITYGDKNNRNLQKEVDSVLNDFNLSLSGYISNSILSKVNENIETELDKYFITVFQQSKYYYDITDGAFDISASPMFSVWGFGFGNKENITPELIDSLKNIVGMDKISLQNNKIVKSDKRVSINTNAIAKGYATDVVAQLLLDSGIDNFLVEIGGEIVARGHNKKGLDWTIGIDKPADGNYNPGKHIVHRITLKDEAVATSGNYRQFYIKDGKKYSHTINPKTGYPVQHSLLSATVIAKDCMSADAVATSLMVMGIEKAIEFLEKHPEFQAYLIYEENGEYKEFETMGVK